VWVRSRYRCGPRGRRSPCGHACAIGLSGSNAFHILATHYIPAAEAHLLSYLWPVEIVAAGAILGLFKLQARQIVGLGLGFAGAAALMAGGKLSISVTGVVY
jgi:drug/metabolite transporter (DMT)-like permease